MITILDQVPWSQVLVSGNGEFVTVPNPLTPSGELYVISNVRTASNSFAVLKSIPVPPSPGPGASFETKATYVFNEPNTDFDPVAAYDPANQLLHILGTRNTPTNGFGFSFGFNFGQAFGSSPQLNDLIKFTFDTNTNNLTGPFVLSTGARIRGSYDIAVLPNSNVVVGVCLADPILAVAGIASVDVHGNVATVTFTVPLATPYAPGQWVLVDGLTNATFLNGQLLQVLTANATQFTAPYGTGGFGLIFGARFGAGFAYGPTAEPSGATASPVGESLLAMELTPSSVVVPGTAVILDSSPSRTGNSFDAVSLVAPPLTRNVELYYQTHPKNITFQDQLFTVALFNRAAGTWDPAPTVLTTFPARWADDRLTVLQDTAGNRYMSQTYWTQLNHPEGIVGNAFLGFRPAGGFGYGFGFNFGNGQTNDWLFHPTFGTTVGGSIIQGTLSVDENLDVSYIYLLQPFDQIPAPPSAIAWPLHVASVAIPSLNLTEVPGFYNGLNLTWVRGTKSLVDDLSAWAVVGETEGALPPSPTTVPLYVSLFNVPPIANVKPPVVTLWRNNTWWATDVSLATSFAVASGVVTVQAANDFVPGEAVAVWGFQNPPNEFLNGTVLTVLTANATSFTAALAHANYTFVPGGFGFGLMFGLGFGGTDAGYVALLEPGPLVLDASGSTSPSLDPLGFTWTENYPGAGVTIAPTPSGSMAELTVADSVGGPGFVFDVGVAVTDTASPHPPATATVVSVSGGTVTFTINNAPDSLPLLPFAPREQVMPYDIAVAYGFGLSFGLNFGDADNSALGFLNDRVLTVLATPPPTSTSFSALCSPGSFSGTVPVTGFVMPQFQFAQTVVTVPTNVAPTVTFPNSSWSGFGNVFGFFFGEGPYLDIARNTTFTVTPNTPLLANQYPVVYTGLTDPDDVPTFSWVQTSGTTVAMSGTTSPSVTISTAGANILGETLTFQAAVDDGVNPTATASFSVNVPAYAYAGGRDSLQLSRSTWGLGGFGLNFGLNFGNAAAPISQRNTPGAWSPLDVSVIYTDLESVRRVSVLDGSDRYIVVSPYSVLVYGIYPSTSPQAVLLRVLLTPNGTLIQDAVHAEEDYTLVLDSAGTVYRYTTAPNFYTDAPDTSFDLADISTLSFVDEELDNDVRILTTQSFLGQRVLVFSGEQGALLLQASTATLAPGSFLELTTATHFLYGCDKVQFVRWVGMENLGSGDVLLGTVANDTAEITGVAIASGTFAGSPVGPNTLLVTAANDFAAGEVVVLSGLTAAPTLVKNALNGMYCTVVSASSSAFIAYMDDEHVPQPPATYPVSPETGIAVSQDSGTTYESLISLANKAIIGAWDKSKLKNQFVNTGEILFDPDTTYAGRPIPPALAPLSFQLSGTNANIALRWVQQRADLVGGYTVQVGTETVLNTPVPAAPYQFQVPVSLYFFDANVSVTDVTIQTASVTLVSEATQQGGFGLNFGVGFGLESVVTFTAANTFTEGQQVVLSGLTFATWLNGVPLTVLTASPTQFQVVDPTSHTPFAAMPETGTAVGSLNIPLAFVPYAPGPGQYTVSPAGLYTFNAAQSGHSVNIGFIQLFRTVANVVSGGVQNVTVQLPAGPTYFFQVEATSLDGASGYSNIQEITT
jgi:hypothetical protein